MMPVDILLVRNGIRPADAGSYENHIELEYSESKPYFIFEKEKSWEKFGIRNRELSRYWLSKYPDIRNRIVDRMKMKPRINPDICSSEEFIFGLVSILGSAKYDPLVTIVRFFDENQIQSISMPKPDGWFGEAIGKLSVASGIPCNIYGKKR